MNVRRIELEEDLPEIARWLENRKWPMPPLENVGPGLGMIADQNGVKLACIWIYTTGRGVAFIEWFATNPDVPLHESGEALESLIQHLKAMCEVAEPRISALMFFTKNQSLAKHLSAKGFKKEEGYTKLLWTLK